jgi:hypothetical protein
MVTTIRGDRFVRGHSRTRSSSLEPLIITTVDSSVYQLTVSSPSLIFFVGTDQNQYINLGSASTYQIGHRYELRNDSSEKIIIRDFSLNVLIELVADASVVIDLEDNSSSSGIWFVQRLQLENTLVDLENIVGITGSNSQLFLENFLGLNGLPVVNEIPTGDKNCINLDYSTDFEFIPNTLEVFLSGIKLEINIDYTENVGNQGFTVILNTANGSRLNKAPMPNESLTVNYSRKVIFP